MKIESKDSINIK